MDTIDQMQAVVRGLQGLSIRKGGSRCSSGRSAAGGRGVHCVPPAPDQAAQTGPFFRIRHPWTETGPAQDRAAVPLAAAAVALDGQQVVGVGRDDGPLQVDAVE